MVHLAAGSGACYTGDLYKRYGRVLHLERKIGYH